MYDFYFGSDESIKKNEIKFLISIKRMMPRWVNSLPDSEFVALAKLLDEQGTAARKNNRKFVVVETGVGASSLAFIYYAMKYNGMAYTWDTNGEKGSLIRTVCSETMGNYFRMRINNYWQLVAFYSTSQYLGLSILNELDLKIDMFFHDSEHVWTTIENELKLVMPMLKDGAVVALDDANLDFLHTNVAYLNTFRKKLNLPTITDTDDNKTEPFYIKVGELLNSHWEKVDYLQDSYKENCYSDPYFSYYKAEFDINANIGTIRSEALEHRFDSWRVSGRKQL